MIVFIPHVEDMLQPATVGAVIAHARESGDGAIAVKLHRDDAYGRLLTYLFGKGQPFLIVEQDVVPHRAALAELAACPEPWCAFPYSIGTQSRACLGCAKFDPSALGSAIELRAPWRYVDLELESLLEARGFAVHVHAPAVAHLRVDVAPPSPELLSIRARIAALRGT